MGQLCETPQAGANVLPAELGPETSERKGLREQLFQFLVGGQEGGRGPALRTAIGTSEEAARTGFLPQLTEEGMRLFRDRVLPQIGESVGTQVGSLSGSGFAREAGRAGADIEGSILNQALGVRANAPNQIAQFLQMILGAEPSTMPRMEVSPTMYGQSPLAQLLGIGGQVGGDVGSAMLMKYLMKP